MQEKNPGPQPKPNKKPAPKKAGAAGKKRVKVSRLGYYIIIFGWLTIAVNLLLAFEWAQPSVVLERVMSAELDAFAFRAIALIIPLIFSILGYMVYQREKVLWRAIATGRKLEHMNVSLQTNYEKLSGQMSDKDKSGLSDQAIETIKGIHRHTKWSINMIASLMGAQSKKIADEKGADALMEFQRRFRAVENIHEALSKGDECAVVSAPDYLKMIGNEIVSAFDAGNVRLSVEAKPWIMDIDMALYCGLIVSELVSNSMRFAFADDAENPGIRITLDKEFDDGTALLRVSDNGGGMPEGLDVELLDTLGLKIIGKLARQLKGTMETTVMGGTSVEIKFPLK